MAGDVVGVGLGRRTAPVRLGEQIAEGVVGRAAGQVVRATIVLQFHSDGLRRAGLAVGVEVRVVGLGPDAVGYREGAVGVVRHRA